VITAITLSSGTTSWSGVDLGASVLHEVVPVEVKQLPI